MPHFDWRSPDTYDHAAEFEPTGFAWECLRRNPEYHRDHDEMTHAESRHRRERDVQKALGPLLSPLTRGGPPLNR